MSSSSPWGKIEKVEKASFAEIMSEEYARNLQNEENKKYGEKICNELNTYISGGKESDSLTENCKDGIIPEDVLRVIREDATTCAGQLGDFCESDALIAQVLQSQFDREYNEELKRIEKQKNKDSKVSISFDNYRRQGDNEPESEEEYDDNDTKKDWDRFETNEKKFHGISKRGFNLDGEGSMITKHDAQICGVRNACRVMSFPPEFQTGDAAGFEMKLPNAVFNQLKTYSRKSKKNKMHDRLENFATAEMGVDEPTRLLLYKLINNQILDQVNGIISTGKEAVILHAETDPNYIGDLNLPKECAIKIFKTTLNEFKQRDRYIKYDYRFKDRFSKQNNRVIINMWAEKEMHNLMRMQKCGINCPDVITLKKHVLVMSFIGDNHNAAPKLKDARLSDGEWSFACEEVQNIMYKLYNEANLVHADLSEYNVLWYDDKCWVIDVAQSVEPGHPSALEFLMRDCDNIINFFSKRGLSNLKTKEELFEHITGLNAQVHNAAMLERIHAPGGNARELTIPGLHSLPEEFKLPSYPFELAWEKSLDKKQPIVESAEALQELDFQMPQVEPN
uniref:Serine/threonine-protein kinase RIO3 n=1 Tax=Tabanus bromius TaxID=304241 RepID=A0A0K8TM27_TABBR